MARKDDQPHGPENGNIRIANPADLMRDNPAALIVNRESYARMAAHFSPDQFDPPQVVRVATYSSQHGEVVREFVLDGMTRIKFLDDNGETVKRNHPDFQVRVRDVTVSILQNRAVVPIEERVDGAEALTMLQYLRAVIPPTVEHSQIAPDRIAAHLINGWENMVGEDLAKKYSALAALSLLGNPNINVATDDGLKKDLNRQTRLMAGETIDERVQLQAKLCEMAAIIRESKLVRQEISKSAFLLVSAASPVIGGEREARNQIFGLLHTPAVDRKLADGFTNISEREQMRDQLGRFITLSFKKVADTPNGETALRVLGEALNDPHLGFSHVLDVLTAEDPIARNDQVKRDVNRERLAGSYLVMQGKAASLSFAETQLIDILGGVTLLNEGEIQGIDRAIKVADGNLTSAQTYAEGLLARRDELLTQGVNAQLLEEAVVKINDARSAVLASDSLNNLRTKNQLLADTVREAERRINLKIAMYRVGTMLDEITGERLKEGYGPQIRTDIIGLVIGEFQKDEGITDRNIHVVRNRIGQYASLDHDLILQIKDGNFTLNTALRRQEEKGKQRPAAAAGAPSPIPPVEAPQRAGRTTAAVPLSTQFPLEHEGQAAAQPEEAIIDSRTLNEQRIRVNREKFNAVLDQMEKLDKIVNEIDLKQNEYTDEQRERLKRHFRNVGKLAYDHPNAPGVMETEYPRLLRELEEIRAKQIDQDLEDAQRDARTGR